MREENERMDCTDKDRTYTNKSNNGKPKYYGNKKNNSRKKGKGRNGTRKPYDKKDQIISDIPESNDPNWYFTDPKLMDSVSRFSFNNFLGYGSGPGYKDIPYAVSFRFNAAAGNPTDSNHIVDLRNNGINIAALKLYTTLSSQSGKTTNYGPEDLAILMLALGSVIESVEYGRRALGLAFTYNNRNWNYPSNIIRAAGFDESILDNLAQKRMDFNVVINSINKIVFPSNIAYFAKCTQMYQNVWLDSDSPMAQSILYNPQSYWLLAEDANNKGSLLATMDWLYISTWDQYLLHLKEQINAILMSSTYNYIYGDVLNYSLKSKVELFHLDLVSEDYGIIPVYNMNILSQIHNLQTTGLPEEHACSLSPNSSETVTTASNNVQADAETGCIIYNPAFHYNYGVDHGLYVDSLVADPDVNTRVDMTRYSIRSTGHRDLYTVNTDSKFTYMAGVALPDHYCVNFYIASRNNDPNMDNPKLWGTFDDVKSATVEQYHNYVTVLSQMAAFDWFPIIYLTDSSKDDFIGIFGDLNYFTELGADYLRDRKSVV